MKNSLSITVSKKKPTLNHSDGYLGRIQLRLYHKTGSNKFAVGFETKIRNTCFGCKISSVMRRFYRKYHPKHTATKAATEKFWLTARISINKQISCKARLL